MEQQCDQLANEVDRLKEEGNVFQMTSSIHISTYQTMINRITQDKQTLTEQCRKLQQQLNTLRIQNVTKQHDIMKLEEEERLNSNHHHHGRR